MSVREALTPGRVSPMRPVPPRIPRPEYVGKPAPTLSGDPGEQTARGDRAMRVAGTIAARALAEGGEAVEPGVTTDEIDRVGARVPLRPRRLPVHPRLPRLPEVAAAPR